MTFSGHDDSTINIVLGLLLLLLLSRRLSANFLSLSGLAAFLGAALAIARLLACCRIGVSSVIVSALLSSKNMHSIAFVRGKNRQR